MGFKKDRHEKTVESRPRLNLQNLSKPLRVGCQIVANDPKRRSKAFIGTENGFRKRSP